MVLIAAITCVMAVIVDYHVKAPDFRLRLDFVMLAYFSIAFFLIRYKRLYLPVLYPTLVLAFLTGPIYWQLFDELVVSGALVHIAAMVGSVLITPSRLRQWIAIGFFVTAGIYVGNNMIDLINTSEFQSDKFTSNFYFLLVTGGVGYLTHYLRNRYEVEKLAARTFGQNLRELYRLSLKEWTTLDDAFENYLSTGMNLLGANKSIITKKEWNKWRIIKRLGFYWSGTIDSFDEVYDVEVGSIRSEKVIPVKDLPISEDNSGSLLVAPIFLEGSFFGHLIFEFAPNRIVGEYELELAVLMSQNLGYILASEEIRQEERKTREALNLSEIRFKRVFERANVGIVVADLNRNFIMTNPAYQKMLGYSEEELLQMGLKEVTHPEDFRIDADQYQKLIAGEIQGYQIEKRNIRKDKEVIKVRLTASLIHDFQGSPAYGIGIIEDITQRKKDEEEISALNRELAESIRRLESTNRELESFSYSVSHDLRAPLRAINGFSKILVDEYGPKIDEEGNRLIDVISTNATKMGSLIDDLLAFSQLSRQTIKTEKVDLNTLIKEVIAELSLSYPADQIITIEASLPSVLADRNLLRQALINVIGNSLKFTSARDKPQITISCETKEGSSVIAITDNGVGFDMKYHDKIFKVFQRLHTDDEFKGTGVGLAIVERVINRHGGKVWANSQLGEGTTFNIQLPA